jgi:Dihaem cytochrome c
MGYARLLAGLTALGVLTGALAWGTMRPTSATAGDQPPEVLQECGACHMVYPPQFLPQRSWTAILSKLADHFGEIASLPDAKKMEIAAYLAANAADGPLTVGGRRFLRGVPAEAAPLRITEMPWWIGAHEEVNFAGIQSTRVKSASNCLGCHGSSGGSDDN